MSRDETIGIAHVVWFVSAIYFITGSGLAWVAAVVGFGLVAAGFSYADFRLAALQSIRRRARR
jgi:hypothetical protein